jgi:hypothetical protein
VNRDQLEDEIRAALRGRADRAPVLPRNVSVTGGAPRRVRGRLLLAGAVATVALAALAVAVTDGDEPTRITSGDPAATAAAEQRCARISAFADALVDVGDPAFVDFDRSSESPSSLASRVAVVFAGRLTGAFAHRAAGADDPGTSWVGFEVEVDAVVQGALTAGERIFVAVPYDPAHRPSSHYEDSIVAGAEVVVFARELSDPPARLFVGNEGLATACDGGAPIGLVGNTSAWRGASTLRALLDAADAPAHRVEVGLWHCGINPITVDDRTWEVPTDEERFDGTNAPKSFAGVGTIERVSPDELRYVDDSGVVLRFVPDDGTEPPCA